jgi:Ca2+-binding RTX toxin-like protein
MRRPDDTVFGDGGNDTIYCGGGDGWIDGGTGNDTITVEGFSWVEFMAFYSGEPLLAG